MRTLFIKAVGVVVGALLLSGCALPSTPYDYTAYRASRPTSVLILPPINHSPEVKATYSVLAQLSRPLGEAGYYVLPVALVDETFRGNGMTTPEDIQSIPFDKLHDTFGADAALYVVVEDYGTSYHVINSDTTVTLSARLVDLRTGTLLWQGAGYASTAEERGQSSSLAGMLLSAIINQIVDSVSDYGHEVAGRADERLLSPQRVNGILPGPHSPTYAQAMAAPTP
ncbi:DUF799 domain-containing protein [Zymobacter palmae]|uniref:Uncharacterized protein conserved in bacteria n=1 Tax=Zymobacter palmae TaxID=33074 RepID=A0A348HCT0_9GAMM|nr:DUF799 domain-containing protein [Zymobacter palmae]BBG29432.1 uncharacterized protein conserved in bacteria [Zymobacter palmae]